MFGRAVELDPSFTQAHAELSMAHSWFYFNGFDPAEERLARQDRAKAAVERAHELEPDLPETHLALGYYYYWIDRDYDRAVKEFSIAAEGLPNSSRVFEGIGYVQRRQGKLEASAASLEKALELDPQNGRYAMNLALTHRRLRDYSEADRYFNRSITLSPNQVAAYVFKVRNILLWRGAVDEARAILNDVAHQDHPYVVYMQLELDVFERRYQDALDRLSSSSEFVSRLQGRIRPRSFWEAQLYDLMDRPEQADNAYEEALVFLKNELRVQPDDFRLHSALGLAYAGLGRKAEAIAAWERSVELFPLSGDAYIAGSRIAERAQIDTMVGDFDAALNRIEHLLSTPTSFSVKRLELDPTWDPLRNHPRYQQMIDEFR